jgi:hypothetical protein
LSAIRDKFNKPKKHGQRLFDDFDDPTSEVKRAVINPDGSHIFMIVDWEFRPPRPFERRMIHGKDPKILDWIKVQTVIRRNEGLRPRFTTEFLARERKQHKSRVYSKLLSGI